MFHSASTSSHISTGSIGTVARQRTLKSSMSCTGIGLHSGTKVTMTLRPGAVGTGIVFRRIDIAGGGAVIPAHWRQVNDTRLNTCIGTESGVAVRTIEHLMSALAGMRIDNAVIDINGPEVPVMDGSAAPFLFLIECAGVVEQEAPRKALKVLKPVSVRDGDKIASLIPAARFSVHFEIDFDNTLIAHQEFDVTLGNGAFKSEIARARTFGFEHEVTQLRQLGLARGGSLDNAVVISGNKVLNEDGLRYDDEFVRHKVLDAVGDLYLAGGPILGHFHGVRSGHALNNRLLHELFRDGSAWAWTTIDDRLSASLPARPVPTVLAATA
ncbi:MAG: UDP-3-O-acyl-N-acetylglucosamine deacetylase [Rhodospirillales bacterium]|nr:UDP-3-O-acyl-N-acetylglucosamine deacetylase [Rhodospirillales bacterium]